MVHVSSLRLKMTIQLARKAQIAFILTKEVTVLAKYSYFAHVFLEKPSNVLPEQTKVNEHTI